MRSVVAYLAIEYVCIAMISSGLHYYVGTAESSTAKSLLRAYLSVSPANGGDYVAGFIDLVMPAVCLGFTAGVLGTHWSPRRLAVCVAIMSIGMTALFPVYAHFIPKGESPWWPDTLPDQPLIRHFILIYLKEASMCGMAVYFGRLITLRNRG